MRILCAYSGIEFTCEHVPGLLQSREACHPIFQIPQKKLLAYLGKYSSGGLTETDSYLLFTSLLHSSDLIEFRVPTQRSLNTNQIVALNLAPLCNILIKMNTVTHPGVHFMRAAITPETSSLGTVHHWIYNWEEDYKEFKAGRSKDYDDRKLVQRENALRRLVCNEHKPTSAYASQIADWAATAGNFPTGNTPNPWSKSFPISISDYWKQIIIKCAHEEHLWSVTEEDLQELIDHCETNISWGAGIFAKRLFQILRHAQEKQNNFIKLGDKDIGSRIGDYTILEDSDTVESANMQAIIASAPEKLPRPEEYPTKFQYLKAKMRWDMSQKFPHTQLPAFLDQEPGEQND